MVAEKCTRLVAKGFTQTYGIGNPCCLDKLNSSFIVSVCKLSLAPRQIGYKEYLSKERSKVGSPHKSAS